MKKWIELGLLLLLSAQGAAAPKAKAKADSMEILTGGAYSAQVKGIVCLGCGEYIKQTLQKIPGVEQVSVDQGKKTVQFKVKEGSKLKLAEVQQALRASAEKMGMGADYQLRDLKKQKI
jgi:copper chaperone CopZ